MTLLFNRSFEISFKGADISPVIKLRVAFDVDKQDGEQFNAGVIRIYNLNSSSRSALARVIHNSKTPWAEPRIQCTLSVGYGSDIIQMISGDVIIATNQRIGPDWVTDIEIYTGWFSAKNSGTQLHYGSKTSAKKIIDDLLSKIIGFDVQYTAGAQKKIEGKTVLSYTMVGLAYNEAKIFLSKYGLRFAIEDDGIILVYVFNNPRDEKRRENNTVIFKPLNGLLGSPKVTRVGVEFKALLRPQIKILQRVYVESQSINETLQNQDRFTNEYFVTGLKHTGDTYSDEWYTEISASYVGLDKDLLS